MIGKTLSHYKILDELSRGGMGVVYRAVDTKLNREIALKVLPENLIADPERKRRFTQEAQAAASLEHPNIAVIYEIDEADGVTFMVMELIRGEKLSAVLEKERPSLQRSLDLCLEVAEGLAEAHDKGIVHRDLKPDNVMLAPNGHAKIIDFGLAKLVEPLGGDEETEAHTAVRRETDPGVVMGTASYMSPEQGRGAKVDHRSDIFSFGIVLYELMSGKPPFQGNSGIEILNAILKETPAPLPPLGGDVMPEAAFELQHIVDKCLAKDVRDRYQGMKDLVVDLRSARRRLESTTISGVRSSGAVPVADESSKRNTWLIGGGIAALVLAGAFFLLRQPSTPDATPTASPSKPSIAVLFFDNNTGDPSLDWLRTALADMLITDLSQSPDLRVIGTDRLYQILRDLNQLDERITSFDVVQEVAKRAGVNTVLLGSFVKAGENIRISIKIQEAETGEILTSEKVEGVGEESIFPMVDDLTRRIKNKFEIPRAADASTDRGLQDVTTSSVEAYRYYVEGVALQSQGKNRESITLLERAVEIDPNFAMALATLSDGYFNEGRRKEYLEHAKRAFENADRMTPRERYFIEGNYYTLKEETFAQGIDAYKKGLELWPDHEDTRNNLAWTYGELEMPEDEIEHMEELRRQGSEFPAVYFSLVTGYSTLGKQQEARHVAMDYQKNQPGQQGHVALGLYHLMSGELDLALAQFDTAQSLRPDSSWPKDGQRAVFILREQWAEAEATTKAIGESGELQDKHNAALGMAGIELFRGRSRQALESIRRASTVFADIGVPWVGASLSAANVHLETGRLGDTVVEARRAQTIDSGNAGEWAGLFFESLAQARLGRMNDARETAERLRERTKSIPGYKEERRHLHLLGELALLEGKTEEAVREIEKAASMLPPRGIDGQTRPQHARIWYSLASAYLAAGNESEAAEWFQRVVDSTTEHIVWPIPYVRSFYFLGKIHESRGDMEKAREYYRRFLDFWRDGDMDRERVEEALSKL